ncbi:hypothetical protein [Micromonospora taraxaci]|uniref:hypothetical protein n=1 Tax=Micromonospora taraxaci TaxID=1316803 RepID=UPI0033AA3682
MTAAITVSAPTAGPGDPPTVPWGTNGPCVDLDRLAALLDDIAQDPPIGPLLADLDAAVARSQKARA